MPGLVDTIDLGRLEGTLLGEAIRNEEGELSVASLVWLIDGYRKGELDLDPTSAAIVNTTDQIIDPTASWGEYAQAVAIVAGAYTFIETIEITGEQ